MSASKAKKEQLLQNQIDNLPADFEKVSNEQEASLIFMEFALRQDIVYRRSANLEHKGLFPDLLSSEDITNVLRNSKYTTSSTDILDILAELRNNKSSVAKTTFDQLAFIYNIKLVSSMKSKELEIKNGKKCAVCGKLTGTMRNVQLRAGDEGTGRILVCTNPKCKAVKQIDRG